MNRMPAIVALGSHAPRGPTAGTTAISTTPATIAASGVTAPAWKLTALRLKDPVAT